MLTSDFIDFTDFFIKFIENSNISKVFGMADDNLLILILGSFIVGYICLTFYYMVYNVNTNNMWEKLDFSEKAIISLAIGFLSILSSILFVSIFVATSHLLSSNDKNIEQLLRLYYTYPFIYFTAFSALADKMKNYQDMEFIKAYLKYSVIFISILIIILIILYIIQS